MNEQEVRSQLETLVRRELELSFARQLKQEEEKALLSDEEWWNFSKPGVSPHPLLDALWEKSKEDIIAGRHRRLHELQDPAHLDGMVHHRVLELLPHLLQVRQESGESGPVTLEQYNSAMRDRVSAIQAESAKLLESSVAKEQVDWKRDIKAQLLANMKADNVDLQRLQDPNVTEETLQEVTATIEERMKNLTQEMLSRFPKPPPDEG